MDDRYIHSCPVGCAAPLAESHIVLPEGPLLECPECGQLTSQVTEQRYWETMAQFDRADFNQPAGRELARRVDLAQRRLLRVGGMLERSPQQIRLLDVGCSRGHFVETAARCGFPAEGVEPAPGVAAEARARGLTVHTGLLEDQRFPDAAFAAVTLFEVIEHLKEPAPLIRECRRVLEPGGLLVLSTGNTASWTARSMKGRWDYFQIAKDAGHVSFYNPRSAALLGERCGFSAARIETSRVRFHEKGDVPAWRYALGKIAAEALNLPARLLGRGHDMLAYLRRV